MFDWAPCLLLNYQNYLIFLLFPLLIDLYNYIYLIHLKNMNMDIFYSNYFHDLYHL